MKPFKVRMADEDSIDFHEGVALSIDQMGYVLVAWWPDGRIARAELEGLFFVEFLEDETPMVTYSWSGA